MTESVWVLYEIWTWGNRPSNTRPSKVVWVDEEAAKKALDKAAEKVWLTERKYHPEATLTENKHRARVSIETDHGNGPSWEPLYEGNIRKCAVESTGTLSLPLGGCSE